MKGYKGKKIPKVKRSRKSKDPNSKKVVMVNRSKVLNVTVFQCLKGHKVKMSRSNRAKRPREQKFPKVPKVKSS